MSAPRQITSSFAIHALFAWLALACTGCLDQQSYPIVDAGVFMTPDVKPVLGGNEGDTPIFRISAPFFLAIEPPSTSDLTALSNDAKGMMLPFPRLPWVRLHDLELQLDYAITNQSMDTLLATVTVNGINEFVYYSPGPDDLNQWQRRILLQSGERVSGTVTDFDLDEVATDLATVVNGAPNSNLVVTFQSQSGRDPRVQPYIPKVIPGLVGVYAGIEVQGKAGDTMAMAPPLKLELTIRVQDHEGRATKRGDKPWLLPAAAPFTPIEMDTGTN